MAPACGLALTVLGAAEQTAADGAGPRAVQHRSYVVGRGTGDLGALIDPHIAVGVLVEQRADLGYPI